MYSKEKKWYLKIVFGGSIDQEERRRFSLEQGSQTQSDSRAA